MSDFDDRPFAAGSLTGIRSFRIDGLCRLTGVSYRKVWTPGENVAKCVQLDPSALWSVTMAQIMPALYGGRGGFIAPSVSPEVEVAQAGHRAGGMGCKCGFYAYFDEGHNPYHKGKDGGQIAGLVEGYGLTTVGSRGFRAEKARLLALIIPPSLAKQVTFARVARNYEGVPVFESKVEAVRAYPLTPPPIPTPQTCPDFWTREA